MHRSGERARDGDSSEGRADEGDHPRRTRDGRPSITDQVGEAAGGVSGMLVGAGIGGAAGPVGMLIGGIAGAIGGWWSGRAFSELIERLARDEDAYYRAHYQSLRDRLPDRGYEDARGAYYLGDIASENPEYEACCFEEIEPDLQRGWNAPPPPDRPGEWRHMRRYASEGFRHGIERRSLADRRRGARRSAERPRNERM